MRKRIGFTGLGIRGDSPRETIERDREARGSCTSPSRLWQHSSPAGQRAMPRCIFRSNVLISLSDLNLNSAHLISNPADWNDLVQPNHTTTSNQRQQMPERISTKGKRASWGYLRSAL